MCLGSSVLDVFVSVMSVGYNKINPNRMQYLYSCIRCTLMDSILSVRMLNIQSVLSPEIYYKCTICTRTQRTIPQLYLNILHVNN